MHLELVLFLLAAEFEQIPVTVSLAGGEVPQAV